MHRLTDTSRSYVNTAFLKRRALSDGTISSDSTSARSKLAQPWLPVDGRAAEPDSLLRRYAVADSAVLGVGAVAAEERLPLLRTMCCGESFLKLRHAAGNSPLSHAACMPLSSPATSTSTSPLFSAFALSPLRQLSVLHSIIKDGRVALTLQRHVTCTILYVCPG